MKWCLYFKNNQIISDIVECEESMLEKESSVTVQVADERWILERTKEVYKGVKKKLDEATIQRLKSYREKEEWGKIRAEVMNKTGENLCCQSAIESYLNVL